MILSIQKSRKCEQIYSDRNQISCLGIGGRGDKGKKDCKQARGNFLGLMNTLITLNVVLIS